MSDTALRGGRPPRRRGVSWRVLPWRRGGNALSSAALATAPAVLAASALAAPVAVVPLVTDPAGSSGAHASAAGAAVSVIVRETSWSGNAPEQAVAALGGTRGLRLGIIDGFQARVPATALADLQTVPGVAAVTPDAAVTLADTETNTISSASGSMYTIAQEATGAAEMWSNGFTGQGVDVALIDSGVVPVPGLQTAGKITHGPDLSSEAETCGQGACEPTPYKHLDTYGHGTHMAGIIAGRDNSAPAVVQKGDRNNFLGMAPDAGIVSVKVADATGATDVSQVIAGIDWVVKHRRANGMNIRVLNLSFGTDGVQSYQLDPLTYAAEVAWRKGIVVVVAAGNSGYGSNKLNNPAYDPYVIAVGGSDGKATNGVGDDIIPSWSSTGDGVRNPDVVAPGTSVLSLRDPGSFLDGEHPTARVGTRYFKGSGTSQAAAVVSGAAALLLEQRPGMSPDQVKRLLMRTARELPSGDPVAQGDGLIDLKQARDAATPTWTQTWRPASGTGLLEAARGTHHAIVDGDELTGEYDIAGRHWRAATWSASALLEQTWSGGTWTGESFSGGSWNGSGWTVPSSIVDATPEDGDLSGRSWSGRSWSGRSWSGGSWSGRSWSGRSWSTGRWGDQAPGSP